MGSDFGHQEVVEQGQVFALLPGRGNPPEAAQTEARDVVDVHVRIDRRLRAAPFLSRRARAVGDRHQFAARAFDECDRGFPWLRLGAAHRYRRDRERRGGSDQGRRGSAFQHVALHFPARRGPALSRSSLAAPGRRRSQAESGKASSVARSSGAKIGFAPRVHP
jgi:hypothetical protein